jgi:hypothetical protein
MNSGDGAKENGIGPATANSAQGVIHREVKNVLADGVQGDLGGIEIFLAPMSVRNRR